MCCKSLQDRERLEVEQGAGGGGQVCWSISKHLFHLMLSTFLLCLGGQKSYSVLASLVSAFLPVSEGSFPVHCPIPCTQLRCTH